LVGRASEAKVLAEVLDSLDGDGRGSLIQVAGEPGIGKSRLLRELRAAADHRGHPRLPAELRKFEAELPFGVFIDALDDWLLALEPERLQTLRGGVAAELAIVLPAFEALAVGRRRELQQERYRAYRAVRGLLSAAAADAPVVLVRHALGRSRVRGAGLLPARPPAARAAVEGHDHALEGPRATTMFSAQCGGTVERREETPTQRVAWRRRGLG
jgi:hypothetical protein